VNTAASIDTLTAQVRALTVDSRRLSTSVYKQLDYGRPDRIHMFGRVRAGFACLGDEWCLRSTVPELELVGRDADGLLVRSYIGYIDRFPPRWFWPEGFDTTSGTESARESARWEDFVGGLLRLPLIVLTR